MKKFKLDYYDFYDANCQAWVCKSCKIENGIVGEAGYFEDGLELYCAFCGKLHKFKQLNDDEIA